MRDRSVWLRLAFSGPLLASSMTALESTSTNLECRASMEDTGYVGTVTSMLQVLPCQHQAKNSSYLTCTLQPLQTFAKSASSDVTSKGSPPFRGSCRWWPQAPTQEKPHDRSLSLGPEVPYTSLGASDASTRRAVWSRKSGVASCCESNKIKKIPFKASKWSVSAQLISNEDQFISKSKALRMCEKLLSDTNPRLPQRHNSAPPQQSHSQRLGLWLQIHWSFAQPPAAHLRSLVKIGCHPEQWHLFKTPRCVQCNGPSILKFCQALFMKFRSRILECYAICLRNCRPVAIEALSSLDNILLCLSSEVTALLSGLRLSHTIFTGNATTQHRPLNSSMVYPVNSSMAEPVQPTNDGDPRMHPTPSWQIRTLKSSWEDTIEVFEENEGNTSSGCKKEVPVQSAE